MLGRAPPEEQTVPQLELPMPRMASWMWRGTMRSSVVAGVGGAQGPRGEVLEDGREVHGGTGADAGGVFALR